MDRGKKKPQDDGYFYHDWGGPADQAHWDDLTRVLLQEASGEDSVKTCVFLQEASGEDSVKTCVSCRRRLATQAQFSEENEEDSGRPVQQLEVDLETNPK